MIDFQCFACQKVLRVGDEHAGARATCPGCGTLLQIPSAAAPKGDSDLSDLLGGSQPDEPYSDDRSTLTEDNPYSVNDSKSCPFCAEPIKKSAVKCRHCGERLDGGGEDAPGVLPSKFDVGKIFSYSWAKFKQAPGLCIGVTFFAMLAPMLLMIPLFALLFGGLAAVGNQGPPPQGAEFVVLGVVFIVYMLMIFTMLIAQAGLHRWNLKFVSGEPVTFSDCLISRSMIPRLVGYTIVYGLMNLVGVMLCIIPGIIVGILYWPSQYLIHEPDGTISESLSKALKITSHNWVNALVAVLVMAALMYAGALLVYIGMIVTIPLGNLFLASCYLVMRREYEREVGTL